MDSYDALAAMYDLFMDDVPYKAWGRAAINELKAEGINDGLVLDLGCGTGTLTEILAAQGYDMIGVDNSMSMLDEAIKKRDISGHDILYLCQDMRSFELYGTIRAVVSFCDSINYITDPSELVTVFKLVNNYLDPGGIFIFDANTTHKYRDIIGENTICENRPEGSFIWENFYDDATGINEYDLTLFIREEDGRFRKEEETHCQRGYDPFEIERLCRESGIIFVKAIDAERGTDPDESSERVLYVLRESGK